ncbi:9591_t:CDS:2, partial [Scutellospora calospora]
EIGKSRMDDEKIHLNKRINLLEKQDLKLSKERITIIKNLFKVGETLASLLTRKIINEDIIREIEKTSPKSTSDLVKNDKRKSIKDKSNSKNIKDASNKSNIASISGLPCNIVCDPEDIIEDGKPKTFDSILLDSISSIFFSDASFIDNYGSFNSEVEEKYNEDLKGEEIKYAKNIYTDKNVVTKSLIMVNRFGQTISNELPKAPKLRLHGYFCQADM